MYVPPLDLRNRKHLEAANDPASMRSRRKFSNSMSDRRRQGIASWYQEGGKKFVEWTRSHYRIHNGEKLRWDDPFLESFCLLMGNPWLSDVCVSKPAQCGFTEVLIALAGFAVSECAIAIGFGFEQASKMSDIVGPRIQTAFDNIEPIQQLKSDRAKATKRQDIDSKVRKMSVGGVEMTFFYTSTTKSTNKEGRQAESAISSFACQLLLGDEVSLWVRGAIPIAKKRMEASQLPTKPFRGGSTPGFQGDTLDLEIRGSKHLFEWATTCDRCGHFQPISPFGNLFKPCWVSDEGLFIREARFDELIEGTEAYEPTKGTIEDGAELRYVDNLGRPLAWFFADSDRQIESAYLGCKKCGADLGTSAIAKSPIYNGQFVCRRTGIGIEDFCDLVTTAQRPFLDGVAIKLPKVATARFSPFLAIREQLTSKNPLDSLQQGLGEMASFSTGKINLQRLEACVNLALSDEVRSLVDSRPPDAIVLGMDQGQRFNWGIVQHWWIPTEQEEPDPEKRWARAFKRTIWYGGIIGFAGLEEIIQKYDVNLGGIDTKPEVQAAVNFTRDRTPTNLDLWRDKLPELRPQGGVYPFYQVALKGQKLKRDKLLVQQIEVPVVMLDRTALLDASRDRIYNRLHQFPSGLVYDSKDESNLLHHFLTSERSPQGRWIEPPGEPDHLFHADSFAEAAVLASLLEPKSAAKVPLAFGSLSRL